jgi:hypothetical protein
LTCAESHLRGGQTLATCSHWLGLLPTHRQEKTEGGAPGFVSQRPYGTLTSFLAAHPGLRSAYPGLFSSCPSGTGTCGAADARGRLNLSHVSKARHGAPGIQEEESPPPMSQRRDMGHPASRKRSHLLPCLKGETWGTRREKAAMTDIRFCWRVESGMGEVCGFPSFARKKAKDGAPSFSCSRSAASRKKGEHRVGVRPC